MNIFKGRSKKYTLEPVPDVLPFYSSGSNTSAHGQNSQPPLPAQTSRNEPPRHPAQQAGLPQPASLPPKSAPAFQAQDSPRSDVKSTGETRKSEASHQLQSSVRNFHPEVQPAPPVQQIHEPDPVKAHEASGTSTLGELQEQSITIGLTSRSAEPILEDTIEEAEEELAEELDELSIQDDPKLLKKDTFSQEDSNDEPGSNEDKMPKYDYTEPPVRLGRRKSVFAEQYDPSEDSDDDKDKVVYPKTDEQRQRLGEAVRNILLFRSLDLMQMQEVLDAMFEKKVQPGEIVIKQGDDGDNFYVIDSGVYNIYVDNKLVGKYDNVGSFGELALMYNMPRAATIEAATAGSLWAMNRQTFRRIVLKSAFKKRKAYETLLQTVPILQSLDSYERMNLCDALMPVTFSDGELIIKQGDQADGMYIIEKGIVRITRVNEGDSAEVEVARLTKGAYFGELALVTHKPRAASVYAVGDVKLAFLDVQAFERLLGPCKAIMERNIDKYEEQLAAVFGSSAITDLR